MKKIYNKLKEYASPVIQIGINLQKNQMLYISSPVKSAEFTRMIVEPAFILLLHLPYYQHYKTLTNSRIAFITYFLCF